MIIIKDNEELKSWVGKEIGRSDPFLITQKFINDYANVTFDTQWIHTDPERCAKESPFGKKPIMHGFLSIALLTQLYKETIQLPPFKLQINCAIDEVKFLIPVLVDDQVYGTFTLNKLIIRDNFLQIKWTNRLFNQKDKLCMYALMLNRCYI